jgi:DNA repair protein RadD
VDECRHGLNDCYAALLARYPHAHVIGLDATPTRPDGRGLGDYYQAIECTAPTSRLIADGHLVPVRCFAPERRRGGPRKGLAGDPVANWRLYGEGRPTVLFTTKVAESLAAVAAFNAAGIPAEHIDAHTPDDDSDAGRDAVVARLRSGRTKVVSNVGIWTEGVDVPELSCCVLLRAAGSCVLYLQCVGRVMRPAPGKADAVLIDHSGACLRHGLPTQDVEWTLDTSDSVDARNRRARKDGERPRPACCPKCFLLFTSSATCPNCGHRLPRRALPPETRAELLVEVTAGEGAAERAEREARDWRRCLAVAAHRGGTLAMASAIWRKEHGRWPDDTLPMPPARHLLRRPVLEVYPECVRRPAS